ncbi:MAG: hypothetical protein PF572_00985 [Patescibacteria group bacterium]|nr:hypothetical protein [Patescibacteria group bacterium]
MFYIFFLALFLVNILFFVFTPHKEEAGKPEFQFNKSDDFNGTLGR